MNVHDSKDNNVSDDGTLESLDLNDFNDDISERADNGRSARKKHHGFPKDDEAKKVAPPFHHDTATKTERSATKTLSSQGGPEIGNGGQGDTGPDSLGCPPWLNEPSPVLQVSSRVAHVEVANDDTDQSLNVIGEPSNPGPGFPGWPDWLNGPSSILQEISGASHVEWVKTDSDTAERSEKGETLPLTFCEDFGGNAGQQLNSGRGVICEFIRIMGLCKIIHLRGSVR